MDIIDAEVNQCDSCTRPRGPACARGVNQNGFGFTVDRKQMAKIDESIGVAQRVNVRYTGELRFLVVGVRLSSSRDDMKNECSWHKPILEGILQVTRD